MSIFSYLWIGSKAYSLDQQAELRLLVNNAMVYYPMLQAANVGYLEKEDRQVLLSMVEDTFWYYEKDWDLSCGCYRFRKGEPFHLDGSVLPFNQQNVFGLCLIELYKATGKAAYRDRCANLARTFAKEIEFTEDGRAIWHYWPQKFYEGWTEADGVSQNTPTCAPNDSPSHEDSGHAALNAAFILEYYTFFGDTFSPAQVRGLRRTLDAICTDSAVSSLLESLNTDGWFLNSLWTMQVPSGERGTAFIRRFPSADNFIHIECNTQIPQIFARLYDPEAGEPSAFHIPLHRRCSLALGGLNHPGGRNSGSGRPPPPGPPVLSTRKGPFLGFSHNSLPSQQHNTQ